MMKLLTLLVLASLAKEPFIGQTKEGKTVIRINQGLEHVPSGGGAVARREMWDLKCVSAWNRADCAIDRIIIDKCPLRAGKEGISVSKVDWDKGILDLELKDAGQKVSIRLARDEEDNVTLKSLKGTAVYKPCGADEASAFDIRTPGSDYTHQLPVKFTAKPRAIP
jgi:hypothetical protein